MTAASGLAPSQYRAIGLTLGALYCFFSLRGVLTQLGLRPETVWTTLLVSAMVWVPGVLALPAFLVNRLDLGRLALAMAAMAYPIAVVVWMVTAPHDDQARADFWIHQIPGLAAVAAILTFRRPVAWLALVGNCLLVEVAMRELGIVQEWDATVVRGVFALAYSGFFFVLVLSMLREINRSNRVLVRSARDQAEAAMMHARDDEIARLDRLTHDFVLSLLSSAADGVPTDKLRVQAETVRRQLIQAVPGEDEVGTLGEMLARITRRCERYGVPVHLGSVQEELEIPRQSAVEIEAAVEEAVRNAVRHATGGCRVQVTDHGVTIRICDDGPGFDPTRVRERLGVTQSILHRMNSLPGGQASIDSAPGRGTVVIISWSPA
ncbi:MAG: ATP-binding protein [Propionibacteriaceae bacterium]|nr:ATP-binding protein [Propionibacteriaceae bacterium]